MVLYLNNKQRIIHCKGKFKIFISRLHVVNLYILLCTGAREQNTMKVRVRKKVSILVKAPEAPLFKYVN